MRLIAKKLGAAFLSAIITGLITGILLRVIMGIVALVFPETARGLTFAGVTALLLVGIGFSLVHSIWFSVFSLLKSGTWLSKGLLYGLAALLVYGAPFFLSNPDNDLFGPQAPLGILLFSLIFIIGGLSLSFFSHAFLTWTSRSPRRDKYMYMSAIVLTLPACWMLAGTTYEMFVETIPAIQANW